jgi:cyclase
MTLSMRIFGLLFAVALFSSPSVAFSQAAAAPSAPPTAAPAPAAPEQDYSKVEIKTTDLGHKTYMLEGQGGNITIAVAANGVIMVDGQFAPLHDKVKAAIAAVTKQPVRFLVNTHYHGDHTGGNAGFHADGVGVVAHEYVRKRLADGTTNGLTGRKTPPAPEEGLPGKTYGKAMTLQLRGRKALLQHIVRAHTDGDTFVYFPDANVISTGDIFVQQRHPNIDFANGGSIDGMIAGVNTFIKRANDATRVVPGHGRLATRADLVEYRDMLVTARERMAKLIGEGRTEDEVLAAKPFADFDAKVGANDQASQNFMRVVYRSLKQKK